MNEYDLHLK